MATIHQVITADEKKALDAYRRMDEQQRKMVDRMRQMKRESRGAGDEASKMLGPVNRLVGLLGVGGGLAGGVTLAKRAFAAMDEYARRMAENVRNASSDMAAFAMMQEPGTMGTRTSQAVALGARYGVAEPGRALFAVQAMQAKTGTFEQGMEAAEAIFALKQRAGVPLEGARQAVAVGMGLNLRPGEAARAAYAGGKASQLSPAELAQMAGQGLPAYMGIGGGPITGYGVAAALSGLISDPGMLGTYTRQVGVLLQQRTGKPGKLWEGLGFERPGEKPIEQLQALQKAGITTMGDLQASGFAKKESLGLSILLADLDSSLKTMAKVRELYGQEGLIQRERTAAEREVPEIKIARKIEETEARMTARETIGKEAQWGARRDLWEAQLAEKMQERGLGWFAGADKRLGRMGRWGAGVLGLLKPHELAGPGDLAAPGTDRIGSAAQAISDWTERAVQSHLEAVSRETRIFGGDKPAAVEIVRDKTRPGPVAHMGGRNDGSD